MVALVGSRSGVGEQNWDTDLRYFGSQSMKVGSWSDEADIVFPIKTGRIQAVQAPDKAWVTNRFQGSKYSSLWPNHGNPYSSGNLCPIDPHKWKLERDIPYTDLFLAPSTDHGNFQKWNGCFRQENSKQIKPSFGDLTFVRLIGTLDLILKDAQIFGEHALSLSLSGPVFINRPQWGKDININILSKDFYMIEFMSNKEKWQAKNRGPYILDGIEVHIIDWQPNFNPQTYVLPDSKVWIRLYNCPSNYWHIDVIKDICKNFGAFVLVDDILEDKLWGSFLGICISTNQINKIPDEVRIIGAGKIWIQKINREDQMHICPKFFSLDHTGISCDVSATIQQNYSCMQSPIEDKLQLKPLIADETEDALCNDTLEKENVTLTEADIESKIADSLPPSPFMPRNQLAIEDRNLFSQCLENDTIGVLGGQTRSPIGIEVEDGEIETSSSEGEEDFEPDSKLIMEVP
ncbi:hypothetical protein SUGI_0280400 [Cryptomeria japonica]|nr:hypothetical protein SUGI_0280400 [Cryptomeria japonica]